MEHLQRLQIVAESINSKMTVKERSRVLSDLNSMNPATRLLYVTPEQAATNFFQVCVACYYFLLPIGRESLILH